MSVLINSYVFAASVVIAGWYALVRPSSNVLVTSPVVIPFDTEVVDTPDIHSTVTNTSRLTIPSAWNGRYGRLMANWRGDAEVEMTMLKNGSTFVGSGVGRSSGTTGDDHVWHSSAPILLATNDYFEIQGSGLNIIASNYTWAQLELMPSTFDGALVKKTGSQAISASTTTALSWAAEEYDLGGWHDNVTNNDRLTVPAGVSLVRASASAKADVTDTGQTVLSIYMNGAIGTRGLPSGDTMGAGTEGLTVMSAPIAVIPGDYFSAHFFDSVATNVPADNEVWFAIEKLPSDLKYCIVYRSTDFAVPSGNVLTAVQWNAEQVDTDTWHDTGANTTRLTVPLGVTHVRVSFSLQSSNTTGQWGAAIIKNGSSFVGEARVDTETTGSDNVNAMTAILEVIPGDYFEIHAFSDNANNVTTSVNTWACIEEVRDASV